MIELMKLSEVHEQLGLSNETLIEMYKKMVLTRRVDERMWLLNRAGKIPFLVSGQGQEGAQIATAFAMDLTQDYLLPYYRDLGVVLSSGMTAKDIMLSAFAKAEDPNSGGRQMPEHFGDKKNRIATQSSPVTTQFPNAAGFALGIQLLNSTAAVYTSTGDGSSNQGDFHEGINFASVHDLPVVFVIENNGYAISVPADKQYKAARLSDRAIGYGIPGFTVDSNDIFAVYAVMKEAFDRARRGEGPTLIETMSYRFAPHSSDDDDMTYRTAAEVKEARDERDPVVIFENYLLANQVIDEDLKATIEAEVKAEINEATDYAENAAYAEPESALRYVYEETEGV
ncbi:thiamine pyrophosphate-dependent dehydrogenase E1 component subunit alpha [Brochothrix campestris]|uniref:2-oxoisovalerate dehydrogenase subunit alpha n=1 Tax=Brochothrix campestris FSL F6-1037 TaxID=1265861 RepID=W7CR91_9LIST|nr:thiamine pyrophosphate-dependent dehydrogenase E1 component subunit alpha [Brochothrix campestris]EUJ38241.1 2-oxoisovalerate dehydrogenase E1 component, subunit alpha [Brochothrix campestris FSL F6-1037]